MFIKNNILKFFLFSFLLNNLDAEPGNIISYELENQFSLNEIQIALSSFGALVGDPVYSISVYKLYYESHRPSGEIDTLSGLVCIPNSPDKAFPILSYQHGTMTLDNDAPSITGLTLNNIEIGLVGLAAAPAGFITLFPDYEGIGNFEKFHPYIVADSYTRAVVNMVRSVRQLSSILNDNQKFQYNDQVSLFGYSEGGYATLAVQKGIQFHHSEEMNIVVSCPMAGPYDLSGTMVDYFLSIPSYPRPYYVPYVLTSHLWTYAGLEVDFYQYFEPFWADTLPSLYNGTFSSSFIDNILPENPLDILLPEVLDEFIADENHFFRQTLNTNTLLDWVPQSPTYIFHGLGDDIIPSENAQVAYNNFIENGAQNMNLILYPTFYGGHTAVALTCIIDGFDVIQNYQVICPKGDLSGDGNLAIDDIAYLKESIFLENSLTEFQWWAGDLDSDLFHSIFDLLLLSDLIQNEI